MHKEENQCPELCEKTADILDNDVLVNLFVSTQKNNLNLCIQSAIKLLICLLFFFSGIFTLNIYRDIWEYGSFFFFLWKCLIKQNKEKMDNISHLLLRFPNFWVRKVILFQEKYLS
jgi:hypothetical protein